MFYGLPPSDINQLKSALRGRPKPIHLRIELAEDNAALDEIVVTGTMKEVTRLGFSHRRGRV